MPDFDRLHSFAKSLALLTAPGCQEPGISSWCLMVGEAWQGVASMWHDDRSAYESVPTALHASNSDAINHPAYYGGADNPYEVIKVIRAWGLSFALGNAVKYIARAGKKDPAKLLEDLQKAKWYLQNKIDELEKQTK